MGAKQSKNNLEDEFVFQNPVLQNELPEKEVENNNKVPNKSSNTSNINENANTLPKIDTTEANNIYDSNNKIYDSDNNIYDSDNNIKNEEKSEFILETNETNDKVEAKEVIVKEAKKDKKKYTEKPLTDYNDSYKPLDLIKPDEILSPELVENIIEEHVNEEINRIKSDYKVINFKRDKLLERTINIIKYGNSNLNYKDINDKYRKSQRKVLECVSNNSECTLSERDIACYQEFEEFKDNIRMLYKKYYNA